ncbi:hypothetical protein Ade02nite_80350 [Paractinoplanes deccanensis]|uniref:Nuclear transport factor 2 family protein n=1 Tax=Paractinoplanes deccanensis TaxID=113561 RepID=A0ABQ3YHA4_9ACTN|nr:hypothetical protein [Actinoplanes deccanensis]GID79394.1 hypothetical protein Ade02nite_80350 [Actinoplanes deccanensis]
MRISDALRDLAFEPRPDLADTLDRYYSPTYTHRSDGKTMDRAAFAAMVAGMRERVTGGTVTVLDELTDGSHYAERHVYEATMADGTTLKREIYIFGTLAPDGRFEHLSETGIDVE